MKLEFVESSYGIVVLLSLGPIPATCDRIQLDAQLYAKAKITCDEAQRHAIVMCLIGWDSDLSYSYATYA